MPKVVLKSIWSIYYSKTNIIFIKHVAVLDQKQTSLNIEGSK